MTGTLAGTLGTTGPACLITPVLRLTGAAELATLGCIGGSMPILCGVCVELTGGLALGSIDNGR